MRARISLMALGLALAACATAPTTPIAPRVDHHQHLLSPAGLAHVTRPTPPEIATPPHIARILAARAEHWNDAAALGGLYTADAVVLGSEAPGWIQGGENAARFISSRFARGYQLTPIAYHDLGAAAEVSGYYSRGAGSERQLIGHFSMTLQRMRDGSWRIASETPVFPGPRFETVFDGADLVALLDIANIDRAVVLSDAYYFDAPSNRRGDYHAQVRAENDWTAAQTAAFPTRLIAFCSFNPLEAYAIEELRRCAASGAFRGLKLHFDTSEIDLANPAHVASVRTVFAEANRLNLAVITHLSTGPEYGAAQAQIFVDQIIPAAPDIPLVIAHLSGGGNHRDDALAVFANAIASGRADNLYFELAQITISAVPAPQALEQVAARLREIGLNRIFYGSDSQLFGGRPPADMWSEFMTRMPLTHAEKTQIANNVAPFAR